MVRKPFLKGKLIPISVMSTAALALLANQASAKSWQDIVMDHHGILTNPHLIKNMSTNLDQWVNIGNHIWAAIQWIDNFPAHLPEYSLSIMSNIFHLLSNIVLETPLFLFDNPLIQSKTLIFSSVSILLVTILTILNGIKRMLKQRYTSIKEIAPKFFIATAISGFAPFLFKGGFKFLNFLSRSLGDLTFHISNLDFVTGGNMGFIDGLMLFGFDIVSIVLLIPILLKTAKRWFELICLSTITPLAMSAYVFNETKYLFNKWFKAIIDRSQVQLVYAFFLFIMSVIIFSTAGLTSSYAIIVRLLILVGGLMTLANPPEYVTKFGVDGHPWKITKDAYNKARNTFNVKNMVNWKARLLKFKK